MSHRETATHEPTALQRQAAAWTYVTTLDPVLSAPRSRIIAVAMLRHAREHGTEAEFFEAWKARRSDWLTTTTLWQRKWQGMTRRPSRARHHDSIEIRERYVRCQ